MAADANATQKVKAKDVRWTGKGPGIGLVRPIAGPKKPGELAEHEDAVRVLPTR